LNGEQAEGAVLYTAQTLTAEEQAQARANINAPGFSDIPQKTSELENDSGFITAEDVPSVPTKTSELENDSGFITADDIPPVPTKTSELENDSGFITAEDIPPVPVQSVNGQTGAVNLTNLVQDLGDIDGEAYDWDIEEYFNTLQESGSYTFHWDEFRYWVDIETLEVDGTTTVQQIYWGTEEGSSSIYYRNLVIENGEIVSADISTYLTFDEANTAFAKAVHAHVRFFAQSQSIWNFCNTVALQNAMPIVIYFDLSTNKTYLIEAYVGNRQPVYKMQRVTEMNDMSYFCQRSSYYYSGAEHWGNWYKFTGEVYTPGR
jgi:hypothetical protein